MTDAIKPFGTTSRGETVHAVTLGRGDLRVTVLSWGAVLQDVRLAGTPHSLTLGATEIAAYEGPMISFGALMGPVANRIRNAQAPIAGRIHQFEANLPGGHTLHGGSAGTQSQVWSIADHGPDHVTLRTRLPEGVSGFPGNREIEARYRVTDSTLDLEIYGTTDAPTLMNIANHSYWNLDGTDRIEGHHLQVFAEQVTTSGADLMVTGARGGLSPGQSSAST